MCRIHFSAFSQVCLFLHPRNKSGDMIRKLIAKRTKNFNSETITNEFIHDDISVDYGPSGVTAFDDTTVMPLSGEQMMNDE